MTKAQPISPRRKALAEAVALYRDEHGYGPDFPELAQMLGESMGWVRDGLIWLRCRGVITFKPWDDEHHWRSFDRGPRYEAVVVRGEPAFRHTHKW